MKVGDRDATVGARAAEITAIAGNTVTLRLGVQDSREGWRYRGQLLVPGGTLTLRTDTYQVSGTVSRRSRRAAMTQEFDHVRASSAASMPGRILSGINRSLESAWHTSRFASAMRRIGNERSVIDRIRTIAIAIAVASLSQPLLIWMMPRTVKPAMPLFVFVVIALVAAVAPGARRRSQRPGLQSRFARWLRR